MNFISRFKSLPISSRRLLSIGIIFALVIALPLFIYAIVNYKFLITKRAASSEIPPTPVPVSTPPAASSECGMCGGIAGIACQTGLTCQKSRSIYPDQSGICVKTDGTSTCQIKPTPPPIGECQSCILYGGLPQVGCGTGLVCRSQTGGANGICVKSDGTSTCTTPPPVTSTSFHILFKLDGVNDDSASYAKQGANVAKVTVKFLNTQLGYALGYVTPPVPADYVGNGVYALNFGVLSSNLPPSNNYALTLKGEKHVAIKFCQPVGQTSHCANTGTISIPVDPLQKINLDFTGVPLPAGDLPPQDGVVTTIGENSDLARLLMLLSKNPSDYTQQDLLTGDLDYNGVINIKDLFLFRKTLQTRYDDN